MPAARLVCLLAVLAVPAAAQPVAAPEACTYDACALRVEPGFFARRVLSGEAGVPVGRLGLFRTDLSDAVSSSERASEQARTYERSRLPAVLATLGAGALYSVYVLGSVVEGSGLDGPTVSESARTAALVGALGLGAVGVHFQLRSERALSRAVWEYNRDLPR